MTAELLGIARAVVAEGAEMLGTAERGSVHVKGDRDFVTDLDQRIEDALRGRLAEMTPDFGFLGEESAPEARDAEYLWALDPIDGTSNFIHGLPLCAVSLALVHRNIPIIGVVAAPFLNSEYYGAVGAGAFANGQPIRVSGAEKLSGAIVSLGDYAVGPGASEKNGHRLEVTAALARNVERVRMFGSAALDLAWVAEGRTDACVILSNKPWDTAAGVVIARESGALVTDSAGLPHAFDSPHTVATTPGIAAQLRALLR
ncbi:inositol monophosphatase family protein [Nocardia sp. NPDC048505]|uniref:inositol monophosphatase family protein n=1 Tax=unclassified Nocardia TaxID=2637762 RepID=UPI0033C3863D